MFIVFLKQKEYVTISDIVINYLGFGESYEKKYWRI